jgi:hypothetical protein
MLCTGSSALLRTTTINKVPIVGHRDMLHDGHPARRCGMSGHCCPMGYYDSSDQSVEAVKKLFDSFNINDPRDVHKEPVFSAVRKPACDNYKPLKSEELDLSNKLYNKDFEWSDFSKYTHYAHMCFRKPKVSQQRSDDYYEKCFENFNKLKIDKIKELSNKGLTSDGILKSLTAYLKTVIVSTGGVSGRFIYSSLIYKRAGIRDSVFYDGFHCLMNVADKIIAVSKGSKGKAFKTIKQCHCENRYPFIEYVRKKTGEIDQEVKTEDEKKQSKNRKVVDKHRIKNKKSQYSDVQNNQRNIPWLFTTNQQKCVDWKQNSIITPRGLKGSHKFKFIFKHTGYMRGNDKIKFLTVFVNFVYCDVNIPIEYKNLYRCLSNLAAGILAPSMRDSDIADLFMRTVEALSLWEGMFPDSEQYFSVHELLDLVTGLNNFGPVRGWWAMAGERFMSKLKSFCPKGGTNCLKVLAEKFSAYENSVKHVYENNRLSKNYDSMGRYTDYVTKLNGSKCPIPLYAWNDYTKDMFFKSLYSYMSCLEIDKFTLCQQSSYYRLYNQYSQLRPHLKKKYNSFYDWALQLRNLIFEGTPAEEFPFHLFDNEIHKVITAELTQDVVMGSYKIDDQPNGERCYFEKPLLLSSDLRTLAEIADFRPVISNTAVIKGIDMYGRGPECAEIRKSKGLGTYKVKKDRLFIPTNSRSNLLNNWSNSDDSTCWGKFKLYVARGEEAATNESYGQFNYFLTITTIHDPYLYNHSFANVTTRWHALNDSKCPFIYAKSTTEADIKKAESRYKESSVSMTFTHNFNSKVQFVSLRYVESTQVGICGVNEDNIPILTSQKGFTNEELKEAALFTCNCPAYISRLYLIDYHPELKNLDVSSNDFLFLDNFEQKHGRITRKVE